MRDFLCPTLLVLSLAFATPALADYKKIGSEAEFLKVFGGKQLVDENGGRYRIKADGTMSGKAPDGAKIVGAWKWNGKFWCRNVIVAKKELGTDCQVWEVDGSNYRLTRDKGRGRATLGKIK